MGQAPNFSKEKLKKYKMAFAVRGESYEFDINCPNELSAVAICQAVALRSPEISEFAVWNPETMELICHCPVGSAIALAAPKINEAARRMVVPGVKVSNPEKFQESIEKARQQGMKI